MKKILQFLALKSIFAKILHDNLIINNGNHLKIDILKAFYRSQNVGKTLMITCPHAYIWAILLHYAHWLNFLHFFQKKQKNLKIRVLT